MLEKTLERIFVKKIKLAGGLAPKFVSPGNAGVPDRMVLWPDQRVRFVELKRDTRTDLTALQKRWSAIIKEYTGLPVAVIRQPADIDVYLRELQDVSTHIKARVPKLHGSDTDDAPAT